MRKNEFIKQWISAQSTAPRVPSDLLLTAITGGYRLTWTDNSISEVGFEIQVSINGAAFTVLAYTAANITTYDDLVSSGTLAYRIRAFNSYERSGYSDVSIANPYEDEAVALFARMDEQPTLALKELINKTIKDLKDAGIWAITDKLHKWDLHTTQASLLDWKSAAYNATAVNSPTFTPKSGVLTVTYSSYINLNFIPSSHCVNGSLNNLAFSLDDIGNIVAIGPNFGAYNSGTASYLTFRTKESAGVPRPHLYLNTTALRTWNNKSGIQLFVCERTSVGYQRIFESPSSYIEGTGTSIAMANNKLIIGGYCKADGTIPAGYINNINTSAFWLGAAMTPAQKTAWYSIIAYWKANIGGTF